jgi:hypothetical protein
VRKSSSDCVLPSKGSPRWTHESWEIPPYVGNSFIRANFAHTVYQFYGTRLSHLVMCACVYSRTTAPAPCSDAQSAVGQRLHPVEEKGDPCWSNDSWVVTSGQTTLALSEFVDGIVHQQGLGMCPTRSSYLFTRAQCVYSSCFWQ